MHDFCLAFSGLLAASTHDRPTIFPGDGAHRTSGGRVIGGAMSAITVCGPVFATVSPFGERSEGPGVDEITVNVVIAVIEALIAAVPWAVKLFQRGPKLVHTVTTTGDPGDNASEYRFVLLYRRENLTLQPSDGDLSIRFTGRVKDVEGSTGSTHFVNYTFPAEEGQAGPWKSLSLRAGSNIESGRVYQIPLATTDPGPLQLGPHDRHGKIDITRIAKWLPRNGMLQIVAGVATAPLVVIVVALTFGVVVRPDPLLALIGCGLAVFCAVPGLLASRTRDRVNRLLTVPAGT